MLGKNLLLVCAVALALAACKTTGKEGAHDPGELEQAWRAAIVQVPNEDSMFGWYFVMRDLDNMAIEGQWPTVIYMHGCSGGQAGELGNALVKAGFAVIGPNSIARTNYDGSCEPRKLRFQLDKRAPAIRRADAGYAIASAKLLPWVDADNVFLVGQSEGGMTVASFSSDDPRHAVKARVIGGDHCGRFGLKAPRSEPVLAIFGSEDSTYDPWGPDGHCGHHMIYDNGSESIVYTTGYLARMHDPIKIHGPSIKRIVEFLQAHID